MFWNTCSSVKADSLPATPARSQARANAADIFEVAPALTDLLLTSEPDEIVSFAQHMKDVLAELYRWNLWAAA